MIEGIEHVRIDPKEDIIFEDRVRLLCFYCCRYGTKHTCPPRIPDLDWEMLVKEYDFGQIIYVRTPFKNRITQVSRQESSVLLHRHLLGLESARHSSGYPLATSFVGGSCKMCTNGQCPSKCRNRDSARIPLEAIGVNVQKTLQKKGVKIEFPPKETYMRVGLLLW